VSSKNFTEANLKSDYHFLEDVLQTKNRAKRTLAQNCGGMKYFVALRYFHILGIINMYNFIIYIV
jgi:hypothetical protein